MLSKTLEVREHVLMKHAVAIPRHLNFNLAKLRINLAKVSTIA